MEGKSKYYAGDSGSKETRLLPWNLADGVNYLYARK